MNHQLPVGIRGRKLDSVPSQRFQQYHNGLSKGPCDRCHKHGLHLSHFDEGELAYAATQTWKQQS